MGYDRGGDRYGGTGGSGGDRWRNQDREGGWGGDRSRSGFGDDDGRSRYGRERGEWRGGNEWRGGSDSFGGGWGNQQGDAWNRERPGMRDAGYGAGGSRGSYGNDWGTGDRSRGDDHYARDYQSSGGGSDRHEQGGMGQWPRDDETWGGSGFAGGTNHGRRFDRIDAGSTGTQGAHPMSSPVGGGYGVGYGAGGGGFGSSAREAAIIRQSEQNRGGGQQSGLGGGSLHDRHYSEWRQRQVEQLDSDYQDFCREHQSRFEQDFGGWREKRQGQRQLLSRVTEHMEVMGSDDQPVGTVDKVRGDRIILTKNHANAGGRHHSIPCSWVDVVEDKVRLNKTAEDAINNWHDEDHSRALFEREDQGQGGPHMLNRSFSGTYDENK